MSDDIKNKPEGPAQEPHGKRLMMLPPNPNYPGYVGAHTEDDWCAKAGCIPMCVPATPAPSQPSLEKWMEDSANECAEMVAEWKVPRAIANGFYGVILRHYAAREQMTVGGETKCKNCEQPKSAHLVSGHIYCPISLGRACWYEPVDDTTPAPQDGRNL